MSASMIMVIRHAEKPGPYNGQTYFGVNAEATVSGAGGEEDLVTLGWQRTGALVSLFAPPWGAETYSGRSANAVRFEPVERRRRR